MAKVFQAKIRKLGNSKGVIIPREIIEDMDLDLDEVVTIKIPEKDLTHRNEVLRSLAGIYLNRRPFQREKEDRY